MQWLKDNKPMEDKLADRVSTTMSDTTCKLEIQNVHESDSGIYIARALNTNGEATCTAQLVVQQCKYNRKKFEKRNLKDVCKIRISFRFFRDVLNITLK